MIAVVHSIIPGNEVQSSPVLGFTKGSSKRVNLRLFHGPICKIRVTVWLGTRKKHGPGTSADHAKSTLVSKYHFVPLFKCLILMCIKKMSLFFFITSVTNDFLAAWRHGRLVGCRRIWYHFTLQYLINPWCCLLGCASAHFPLRLTVISSPPQVINSLSWHPRSKATVITKSPLCSRVKARVYLAFTLTCDPLCAVALKL